MLKRLSIKSKITIFYTLCTIFIVAVLLLFMVFISERVVDSDVKDNLVLLVESDIKDIDFDVIDEDDIKEEQEEGNIVFMLDNGQIGCISVSDTYITSKNGVRTFLFTDFGKLLVGQSNDYHIDSTEYTPDTIERITHNDVPYYVYTRIISLSDRDATINLKLIGITQDTGSALHGTTGSIVKAAFIILPLTIVLASVFGYLITRALFKPVGKIIDTAQRISHADDLSLRIDLDPGNDELHVLAKTYNTMLERLQTSFESEKAFTSDSSHELRTPVSIISAQCEYALSQNRTADEYIESLEVISRQSKRMNVLVSQLLSFTRLEQGTQKINFEKVDLGQLVDEICQDMEVVGNSSIQLSWNIEDKIHVIADTTLLSRMITNLLSNAYKYSKETGYIKVTVCEKMADMKKWAVISIEDNGIGISDSDIEKIFRRFFKVDKSRCRDCEDLSTGLGLAFVQKIAEIHKGSVSVSSQLGEGSTFVVKLPIE